MDTSYPRKALDLLGAALAAPQHLPTYLRNLPIWRTPLDARLPWFSFPAIRALERYLRPEHEVFEFGSGGSTLFFARRCRRVLAVESHLSWRDRVGCVLQQTGHAHASVDCYPLSDEDSACEGHPFFHAVQRQHWDIVVVDSFIDHATIGYRGKGRFRPYAFELALSQVKPGGLLVLDDSWMYPELLRPRAGWTMRDYRGLGPCRWGVTSTAIFTRDAGPGSAS